MKKKLLAEPVVAPEILALAKQAIETERKPASRPCAVCGSACTQMAGAQWTEDLCWVCRRLKISAWRDSDQQVSAQE